ncbi:hypothetical protein JG688_00016114 [Phytophthora aleatoria]|uniref:HTH CENPB-type domain-containing protein n=1 Tax=Phytophthora aleatoria TaxID=2496075 RepID=A0A8J5I4Q6_9STRA|nr:hypothetical protein JG688_00016114 [Phytophthora aleatoria]
MICLQAKEVASNNGLAEDMFAASGTWVKRFLHRHKMALRTRIRQGQTTPADPQESAVQFRELVLRTMIEKQCTRLFNADQTGKFLFFVHAVKKNVLCANSN